MEEYDRLKKDYDNEIVKIQAKQRQARINMVCKIRKEHPVIYIIKRGTKTDSSTYGVFSTIEKANTCFHNNFRGSSEFNVRGELSENYTDDVLIMLDQEANEPVSP